MFDRRAMLAAGLGAGASSLLLSSVAAAQALPTVIKFAMRGGREPVTTMTIGKNGPYLVLMDSGNRFGPILREEIATKLNLRTYGEGRLEARIGGATGTDTAQGYEAHQVVFGGRVLEPDVIFLGVSSLRGVDALAPVGLFTSHYTEMDFGAGELRIFASGGADRAGFRAVRSEHVTQDGAFVVQAEIEGRPARLLVDTGAASTLVLFPNFVRRSGLWADERRYLETAHGGITRGLVKARTIKAKTVKFGPYRFQDATVDLYDPSLSDSHTYDGLLGIDFLRRFTVGFDAAGSTLWLKPDAALGDPFPYDYSGLYEAFGKDGTTVTQIAKGSPAEAVGLKKGDRIVGIDTPQKFSAFDRRLSSGPDQDIAFDIERGGAHMPIKMTLKDWL